MRRYLYAFLLLPLLVAAVPSNAFALNWFWLDDLSGPSFGGFAMDWRAYCFTEHIVPTAITAREAALLAKTHQVHERTKELETLEGKLTAAIKKADWSAATQVADELTAAEPTLAKETKDLQEAITEPQRGEQSKRVAFIGGVIVSACPYKPNTRRTGSINVLLGFWRDQDFPSFKSTPDPADNREVVIEPSYSARLSSFLEVGAGAGIAFFSSNRRDSVKKLIIEPFRVDLRPITLFARDRSPDVITTSGGITTLEWGKALRAGLVVRAGYFLYPQGFEQGMFNDAFKRTPAESTGYFSLVFDAEPVMNLLKEKWQ